VASTQQAEGRVDAQPLSTPCPKGGRDKENPHLI
jgi:hypothetical protein